MKDTYKRIATIAMLMTGIIGFFVGIIMLGDERITYEQIADAIIVIFGGLMFICVSFLPLCEKKKTRAEIRNENSAWHNYSKDFEELSRKYEVITPPEK